MDGIVWPSQPCIPDAGYPRQRTPLGTPVDDDALACNRVIRRRRAEPMSDEQTVPIPGFAEGEEPLDAYSRVVTQVAQELLPHVASVRVRGSRGGYNYEGAGSAVVFTDDGYIVTNAHVVGRTQRGAAAFADGAEVQFDVVGSDPLSDLAVVRARGGTPAAARFGDAEERRVGKECRSRWSPY